jgi:methylthioribose-1-phosphate isomerase
VNINTNRTLWLKDPHTLQVLDQRRLPHEVVVQDLSSTDKVVWAIQEMVVRGAPLIGATAAYGVYFALRESLVFGTAQSREAHFARSMESLRQSRPTAVNLFWALKRMEQALSTVPQWEAKVQTALQTAHQIVEEDVELCRQIGVHGLPLLEQISQTKQGATVNILTHCNAGRLGCVEWGTITSPIYQAFEQGMNLHVWVDETRPRNQGANLTAWELSQRGIPHTVIVDNTGGHLMQHGMVDIVLVGADRVTRQGDAANKIGTYLKALAANDNQVPFYVALPSTTIDWEIADGLREIPIEERSPDEVKYIWGWNGHELQKVLLTPAESPALNYGFDVTPARLITGFITERGVCPATAAGLQGLFPEA